MPSFILVEQKQKVNKFFTKTLGRIEFALFLHSQKRDDSVAQLVEHDTFNVGVLGSSPSGITKNGEVSSAVFLFILFVVLRGFQVLMLNFGDKKGKR